MEFIQFKQAVQSRINSVIEGGDGLLYLTSATKDELWSTYINSFPEEDGIRQSFNCNCCRQFIKAFGNVVMINSNNLGLVTIWDFKVEDPMYDKVLANLDALVKSAPIRDVYVTDHRKIGTDWNIQQLEDKSTIRWEHFFYELPSQFVTSTRHRETLPSVQTEYRQSKEVFKRALEEIPTSVTEVVLDLIAQDSLYRGEEHKGVLTAFLTRQREYESLSAQDKDNYCWANFKRGAAVARIRNSVIGALLVDIASGTELDEAVRKFEAMVAPHNYRRPKPVVTARMLEEAERTVKDLGLYDSLARRFAVTDDVSIREVLFADRSKKEKNNLFGELKEDLAINPRSLSRVEEVKLSDFVEKVLPTATSLKILLENSHDQNLVSLIAPVHKGAPSIMKWSNNFSWCYNNNVADSIREKVKKAGGKIEGLLRCSLAWFTYNDLDLHLVEPNGTRICYSNKRSITGGHLDVDMNVSPNTRTPVENIIYPYGSKLKEGKYKLYVHNYANREPTSDFTVEIEYEGEVFSYVHDQVLEYRGEVAIYFTYSKKDGIQFERELKSGVSTSEKWGLKTNRFHPVKLVMNSPNYWEGSGTETGNKHVFFVLEGCVNPGPVRGIFNEFMPEDLLRHHKRVFELLGGRIQVESSDQQLSGLGFSTTSEGSFYCVVEGSFTRTLKVVV